MKVLFHAINGTGLGHVVRLAWIAQALRESPTPVQYEVVSTSSHADSYFHVPSHRVPCDLRKAAEHMEEVLRHVRRSRPDVIVFDTRWPKGLPELLGALGIRRILILRALSAERMENATLEAQSCFDEVILPHTRHELAYYFNESTTLFARMQHDPFVAVGPLARISASPCESSSVLFSLGAGGEYLGNVKEEDRVPMQLATYREAAHLLLARGYCNLRLLAGPLLEGMNEFHPLAPIQNLQAHTLIGPRSTIVGRGGYNTCWEAIGAGSHLVLCTSHNINEDVEARCKYLEVSQMARLAGRAPEEIAEAVIRGHAPNVEAGRCLVNAGLRDVVQAIQRRC